MLTCSLRAISKSEVAMERNEWDEFPARRFYPAGSSVAKELGPSEILDSAPFASASDLNAMWIRLMLSVRKSSVLLKSDIFKKKEKGLR